METMDFSPDLVKDILAGEFRSRKFARGNIGIGDPGVIVKDEYRGQVVVTLMLQEGRLDHRPGRYDPDNLPRDQPRFPAHPRPARKWQRGSPCLSGVRGSSQRRDAVSLPSGPDTLGHRAGGQNDVQFPRGDLGVIIKGLVEIAQPEENDRILVLAFNVEVLLAERCDFGHK